MRVFLHANNYSFPNKVDILHEEEKKTVDLEFSIELAKKAHSIDI